MTEWAQPLRGPAPPDKLQRGYWYRVVDRTDDGFVKLIDPNRGAISVRDSLLRIVDNEPKTVTKVQGPSSWRKTGDQHQDLQYYGVCPKRHRIEPLAGGDSVECGECGMMYDVEDEHVSGQREQE